MYVTKICVGSVGVAPLTNILGMRWSEWSVSASGSFTRGKSPRYSLEASATHWKSQLLTGSPSYSLDKKMDGPRAGVNFLEVKQNPFLCTELNQGSQDVMSLQRLSLIFVVLCIMLYSGEISPTRCNNCVFYSQWLYSNVSGDNLTHHQEYNAVYGHR